jgi:soluble lytic murein transglycosylase-like protein
LVPVSKKLACAILLAAPAYAGEYAVFSSGQRLHIDRHEQSGGIVRLFIKDGVTELAAGDVSAFESDDYVAPPAVAPPVPAAQPVNRADPKAMVHDASVRYGLPPKFVESVAKVESAMNPNAVSPKGAVGVMQLMPSTARAMSADATDPAQNIDAGTRLLRELLLKYNGDVVKALAAYNAGEGAVDRYQGVPPYRETQSYVNKVIENYQKSSRQ